MPWAGMSEGWGSRTVRQVSVIYALGMIGWFCGVGLPGRSVVERHHAGMLCWRYVWADSILSVRLSGSLVRLICGGKEAGPFMGRGRVVSGSCRTEWCRGIASGPAKERSRMSCPCHQLRLSEGESGPAQCTDQWRGNAAEALLQGSGEAPVMAGTRQCRVFPRFGPLGELDDAAFQPFAFPAFLP